MTAETIVLARGVSLIGLIILCVYLWNIHAYLRQSKNSLKAIHRILWDQVKEDQEPLDD